LLHIIKNENSLSIEIPDIGSLLIKNKMAAVSFNSELLHNIKVCQFLTFKLLKNIFNVGISQRQEMLTNSQTLASGPLYPDKYNEQQIDYEIDEETK